MASNLFFAFSAIKIWRQIQPKAAANPEVQSPYRGK